MPSALELESQVEISPDLEVEEPIFTFGMAVDSLKKKDAKSWGQTFLRTAGLIFFLYFFLVFLDLMGASFKVLGGCDAGEMLASLENPIAGLMTGIIATVLVQSSSTTTSIIVSLVGAGSMSVSVAIPVVMGANIGTSVTNTIVSFGQVVDPDQFERAFAGATVHDMFNFLSVLVLLPLELIFHPLEHMTESMKPEDVSDDEKWEGPIKKFVAPLAKRILNANKDVIKNVAKGATTCDDIYADPDQKGLIKCGDVYNFDGSETYVCPAFYTKNATKADDMAAGSVCLVISILGLCFCLYGLVKVLQSMVMSSSTAMIKRATKINPYLAILIGVGVTLLVQSSSITTSVLTPLVGLDVIKLEQMLPLTLGANIGTTCTGLMASMVSDKPEAVQIALCHLFFNIFGILLWFPIPRMRQVPLNAARKLGKVTRTWKLFPVVYVVSCFIVIPAILVGISTLFEEGGPYTAIGVLLVIFLAICMLRFAFFMLKQDGPTKIMAAFEKRQKTTDFYNTIQERFALLEDKVEALESGKVFVKKEVAVVDNDNATKL